MIRLVLDITKRDANVLFDKATGARMTFRNPLCEVPFISENVRRSIVNGKVIDVDGVTGIEVRDEFTTAHDRVLSLFGITRKPKTHEARNIEVDDLQEAELEKEVQPEKEHESKKEETAKKSKSKAQKKEGDK